MLQSVSQFFVKLANLAEAEGRLARYHVVRIACALGLLVMAAVLVLAAVIAWACALYLVLRDVLHPAGALAIVAAVLLIVSVAMGAGAWAMNKD